jgi:hypothetical protein
MLRNSGAATLVLFVCCLAAAGVGQVFDGLTLYSTLGSRTTYLINNSGQTVNSWASSYNCAYVAYLMPDSSIWRDDVYSGASMRGASYGGLVQQYNWDGDIIESFIWSNTDHQQHHDIHPMPNGHVLVVSWDRKTAAQAQALGRQNIYGDIWPDEVVEYDPSGDSVAWEWHFWDHLIQDVDAGKPNYGVVSEHPELLDINLGSVQWGDWMHCNTVDYNEERDEIVVTSHYLDEFYVIDHSTTTAEAAGHTGGQRGKGGDFLYRWGNPQNYDRGTSADRVFYIVHGTNWIPVGYPGAGDLITLNNGDRSGSQNDYSVVTQLTPPLDSAGSYHVPADSAFGPTALTWSYSNGSAFYAQHLGGAYRLPNGNTMVTLGTANKLVEVTSSGQVVWTYNVGAQIGRALEYPRDFAAGSSENPVSQPVHRLESVAPNPFVHSTAIRYQLSSRARVRLTVDDAAGRVVRSMVDRAQDVGTYTANLTAGSDLPAGVYFVRLEVSPVDGSAYGQQVATKLLVRGH